MIGLVNKTGIAALALLASALMAGCSSSPDPYMDWGLNDAPPRAAARKDAAAKPRPRPGTRKRYTYDDGRQTVRNTPRPAWYDDSNRDEPLDDVCNPPRPKPKPVRGARAEDADLHFYWPLNGRVISDFGARRGGERNDGINIAAAYDTPIRASAGGTVSYVGSDLQSYGNLVLIRHQGNYVTAYAHAERLTVRRGDVVKAGEVIGYAGASGDVSSPQLHFEIRRGVTPLNPRSLLVAQS